ncbi:hypothetical protein NBRC116594_04600 [Shimia sp. NS0008-38b]
MAHFEMHAQHVRSSMWAGTVSFSHSDINSPHSLMLSHGGDQALHQLGSFLRPPCIRVDNDPKVIVEKIAPAKEGN